MSEKKEKPPCSTPGCPRISYSRGLCQSCYRKQYRPKPIEKSFCQKCGEEWETDSLFLACPKCLNLKEEAREDERIRNRERKKDLPSKLRNLLQTIRFMD